MSPNVPPFLGQRILYLDHDRQNDPTEIVSGCMHLATTTFYGGTMLCPTAKPCSGNAHRVAFSSTNPSCQRICSYSKSCLSSKCDCDYGTVSFSILETSRKTLFCRIKEYNFLHIESVESSEARNKLGSLCTDHLNHS
jgi:hypothetical protein